MFRIHLGVRDGFELPEVPRAINLTCTDARADHSCSQERARRPGHIDWPSQFVRGPRQTGPPCSKLPDHETRILYSFHAATRKPTGTKRRGIDLHKSS